MSNYSIIENQAKFSHAHILDEVGRKGKEKNNINIIGMKVLYKIFYIVIKERDGLK